MMMPTAEYLARRRHERDEQEAVRWFHWHAARETDPDAQAILSAAARYLDSGHPRKPAFGEFRFEPSSVQAWTDRTESVNRDMSKDNLAEDSTPDQE